MAYSAAACSLLMIIAIISLPIIAYSAGAEEGEALLRFKATLPSLISNLKSWIPGPAPCFVNHTTWSGVICFNSRVWGLQIENMSLDGHLDLRPLTALPGLRTISFMRNRFDGPWPDVKQLSSLKAVYLSENNFSGDIPEDAFAGMRSLKKVLLSKNGFTGPIPGSLTGLRKLIELRLDRNKFTGKLPEFSQPEIRVVDVAFNELEGAIPARLAGMHPGFFRGNPMLCGAPLSVSCGKDTPKSHTKRRHHGWLVLLIAIAGFTSLLLLVLFLLVLQCGRSTAIDPSNSKHSAAIHADEANAAATANTLELGAVKNHHRNSASGCGNSNAGGGRKGDYGRLAFVQEGRERFELHDLLRASAEVLGSGNFGSSFKAVLSAGPTVVVKQFKEMNRVGREDFSEHMRRLGRLSHPNLLPLIAYYYKREEKLLITEFIPNGSLAHMLHGNRGSALPPLDWPARLKIVQGVARGLAFLYDQLPMLSLPHGHLKSSNVLLGDDGEPFLSDYALAPVINAAQAAQVMVAYKSPEGVPSRKSDVWSLGILILEILTGKFPANFLHRGSGSADLADWVRSVSSEVFDSEMTSAENGEGDMEKLLRIGLGCCEEAVEKRMEMVEALERIEQLTDREI